MDDLEDYRKVIVVKDGPDLEVEVPFHMPNDHPAMSLHLFAMLLRSHPDARTIHLSWNLLLSGSGGNMAVLYDRAAKTFKMWEFEDNWESGFPHAYTTYYQNVTSAKIYALASQDPSERKGAFWDLETMGCPCRVVEHQITKDKMASKK